MKAQIRSSGQVLVLFVLFLIVLLGVSALAVDYASWLLTDRHLQNVADHAALAGASQFDERITQGNCAGGLGVAKCDEARAQAWTSLSADLGLGLSPTIVACLAADDSPQSGEADSTRASAGACTAEAPVPFGHNVWVTTPPPTWTAYTDFGGAYQNNFGVVWVRVDREVRSFFAGAIGIQPQDRTGWATAGALPTDFALQIFCRNFVAPESGACGGSGQAALVIDGHGGVRLVRGDIGSNESLKVTAQGGKGVILDAGNMFLVRGDCGANFWNCPRVPATAGGIADDDPLVNPGTANNKNAFYIPPQPVLEFESPLDFASANPNCSNASATTPCVPYKDQTNPNPNQPGIWECVSSPDGTHELCGVPDFPNGECDGQGSQNLDPHRPPVGDLDTRNVTGTAVDTRDLKYQNINEGPADLVPNSWVYTGNMGVSGPGTAFEVEVDPAGNPQVTSPTAHLRFVAFKTNGANPDLSGSGNQVFVTAQLYQGGTLVPGATFGPIELNGVPTQYATDDSFVTTSITNYQALSVKFTFTSAGVQNPQTERRGGAVSWAELEINNGVTLSPAQPPTIPPGYYQSITIDADGCAVLDPTAVYDPEGLDLYQLPGIYRMDGGGNGRLGIGGDGDGDGYGGLLIGDAVTFVFDSDFQKPTGQASNGSGIAIDPAGVLLLNASRVPGTPPCTPTESEALSLNYSDPPFDVDLPYSAVCAAWAVQFDESGTFRDGWNNWPVCTDDSLAECVARTDYYVGGAPTTYRGVTFYFTPSGDSFPADAILKRPQIGGGCGGGNQPGVSFRGILYAPYDDVIIQGASGFNTVGQVLAWTAKFHGCSAYLELDYPYEPSESLPYLLEPTVNR